MNPQLDKTANLNLPPPMPEAMSSVPETVAPLDTSRSPEQLPPPPVAAAPTPPPAAAVPGIPVLLPTSTAVPTTDAASTTNPVAADDNDLIEKEWVAKAKEIIGKTREDPYDQNQQISVVKADYMKKRYNKDIKLSE